MKYVLIIFSIAFLIAGCTKNLSSNPSTTTVAPSAAEETSVIATNLDTPWAIVSLPSGELLVTERAGKLSKINPESKTIQAISGLANTVQTSEGGLMGLALHPQFESNQWLYIYQTIRSSNGLQNQVERYRLINTDLTEKTIILQNIKAAQFHDGGGIAFGPDGYVYITTGDAQTESLAQDTNSLNGKVIRLQDDGSIPSDNPFGNAVYAFGFRNPQGLTWDNQGNLWVTDHGPSGSQSGFDEINLIEKGGNYGWPIIRGDQTRTNMISPSIQSGNTDTWAPAGLVFFNGSLYFTGLRGEALYQAPVQNKKIIAVKKYFKNQYGRMRAIHVDINNNFYAATSNRDGRGTPRSNDDQIIRLIF